MKKLLLLLVIPLIILTIVAGAATHSVNKEKEQYISNVSFDQVMQEVESGDVVIAFYSSKTCGYCKEFEPTLLRALQEKNYQARKIEVTDSKNTEKAWEHMGEVSGDLLGKSPGTPMVIVYQNGEVIDATSGNVSLENVLKIFEGIE